MAARQNFLKRLTGTDNSAEIEQLYAELRSTKQALQEYRDRESQTTEQLLQYQQRLRALASELALSEARERRAIAEDLHDHLGQALAYMKMRVSEFQGNAVFCGFESTLMEISDLLAQAIRYTRSLTVDISPPVLYELGLGPAIEWKAEQIARKHKLTINVRVSGKEKMTEELRVMLFKSVTELLTNVVKHASAGKVVITIKNTADSARIEFADDGIGFDLSSLTTDRGTNLGFGLFSIRERLRCLGGECNVESAPGKGTRIILTVNGLPHGAGGTDE